MFRLKEFVSVHPSRFLHASLSELAETATGITDDSRKVAFGDVYFATWGQGFDGQHFVTDAWGKGASYVVVPSQFHSDVVPQNRILVCDNVNDTYGLACRFRYGCPDTELSVIGVTGTNGKTSVVQMVAHLLRQKGERVATLGTLGVSVDGVFQAKLSNTSPPPQDFYRLLRGFVVQGIRWVVCEVSSHASQLGRVAGCHFHTLAFLNLSPEHMDFHSTPDAYFSAKKHLFSHPFRHGFVSLVSSWGHRLLQDLASVSGDAISVVTNPDSHIPDIHRGIVVHEGQKTTDGVCIPLTVRVSREVAHDITVCASLGVGAFPENVAMAVGIVSRVLPLDDTVDLHRFWVRGRYEVYRGVYGQLVIIDYAHTPDALGRLLATMRSWYPQKKTTLVFGCGGDRDPHKRPLMGAVARTQAHRVIVTADNPRSEALEQIMAHIQEGMQASPDAVILDRTKAIRYALQNSGPEDVVLIVGKGHENSQMVGHIHHPFSDRLICAPYLVSTMPGNW